MKQHTAKSLTEIKILQVCGHGFFLETVLKPQIDYFVSRGMIVEIACPPTKEAVRLRNRGYSVYFVPLALRMTPMKMLRTAFVLYRLIRKQRFDIVHTHNSMPAFIGRIAAWLAGCENIVYTAHGFAFHEHGSKITNAIYFTAEKFCSFFTRRILVVSREDYLTCVASRLCSKKNLRHVSNGIDTNFYSQIKLKNEDRGRLRAVLGIPEHSTVIGIIARLDQAKGHLDLVEAFALLKPRYPDLHLLIVGGEIQSNPHPLKKNLEIRIKELGLETFVTMTGHRQYVRDLLGVMDIFVLPSMKEGLPLCLLEAMAMEIPIVSTRIRGCREVVDDGVTGLLVPVREVDALASAMERLVESPNLRHEMGRAGRIRVEEEFSRDVIYRCILNIYTEILRQKHES